MAPNVLLFLLRKKKRNNTHNFFRQKLEILLCTAQYVWKRRINFNSNGAQRVTFLLRKKKKTMHKKFFDKK